MHTLKSPNLHFEPCDIEFEAKTDLSLLENALLHRVPINHSCDGMGSCTTCRVVVLEGLKNISPPNELEQEAIEDRGFYKNERLACQCFAHGPARLQLPE